MQASDFAGNTPCQPEAEFGLPEPPLAGEVLINEILFDPLPQCSDYLELYNSSEKVIDLSQLFWWDLMRGKGVWCGDKGVWYRGKRV